MHVSFVQNIILNNIHMRMYMISTQINTNRLFSRRIFSGIYLISQLITIHCVEFKYTVNLALNWNTSIRFLQKL